MSIEKIKSVKDITATDAPWFEESYYYESNLDTLAAKLKEIDDDIVFMIGYDKIGVRRINKHIDSMRPFYQDSVIMPMRENKNKYMKLKDLSNFVFAEQKALTALYKKL